MSPEYWRRPGLTSTAAIDQAWRDIAASEAAKRAKPAPETTTAPATTREPSPPNPSPEERSDVTMPRQPIRSQEEQPEEPKKSSHLRIVKQPVPPDPEPPAGEVAAPITDLPRQMIHDATTEALLDQIAQEQNPWTYLNAIEDREVPVEHRQQFYQTFIALIATCPLAEQDALINAGMRIFRYRAETARRDLGSLAGQHASSFVIAASVIEADFIAETVHRPGESPSMKYLVWRIGPDGQEEHEIDDRVAVGSVIYQPPQMPSIVGKSLKLPTDIASSPDTASLLAEIKAFIARFVQLDEAIAADVVSFYVLYTWVADRIPMAPYLHVVGDFASGKTRLLEVLGQLTYRGLTTAGVLTAPVLFRVLHQCGATLLVDEADFDPRDPAWRDIQKIFLVGSTQGAQVLRTDMEAGGEVKGYDAFGPKVLATRKSLGDAALASRCLDVTMYPGPVDPRIPLILPPAFYTEAQHLRNRLLGWRLRHVRTVQVDPYQRFEGLDPRVNQAAIALLAVSDDPTVRATVLARLREQSAMIQQQRAESLEALVVEAIVKRARWHKGTAHTRGIPLKEIREEIQVQTGEREMLSAELVRGILTGPLGLRRKRTGGVSRVLVTGKQLRSLAERYDVPFGLTVEPVPSVADRPRTLRTPVPVASRREPVH